MRARAFPILLPLLVACADDPSALLVEVRTDLVAGVEFDTVEIRLPLETERRGVMRGELGRRFLDERLLTRVELDDGRYDTEVALVRGDRDVLSARLQLVVSGITGVEVLLTSACLNAGCEGTTPNCLNGACLPAGCLTGNDPACASAGFEGCRDNTECATAPTDCLTEVCLADTGVCALAELECPAGDYCDAVAGCTEIPAEIPDAGPVPMMDAGPSDAGGDGGGDPCETNNGGCDPNAECSAVAGIVTCGPCRAGFWAGSREESCMPWSRCAPGTHVDSFGTPESDRTCVSCEPDTYSDAPDRDFCRPFSTCGPGEFVLTPGSATSDRQCASCADGTFSANLNESMCTPYSDCDAGSFVALAGAPENDRVCMSCVPGTYAAMTNASFCAPWTTCSPGTFVEMPGSPIRDRTCSDCPPDTYQPGLDEPSCLGMTDCALGYEVLVDGSSTTDRICQRCLPGQTTPTVNASACVAATPLASLSVGAMHTCAITDGDRIACWGADTNGVASNPPRVPNPVQLASGQGFSCVRSNAAVTLTCWGANGAGQASAPAGSFVDVTAGDEHACAIEATGLARCWGQPGGGRLDPPADTFVQLSAGSVFTCGVTDVGSIQCWGNAPTPVPAGMFSQVASGTLHVCAIVETDGSLRCWGDNGDGQSTPPAGAYLEVSSGLDFSCAVRADDFSVVCWGKDTSRQVTDVPSGSHFSLSAGGGHACAVRASDNRPVCWGRDDVGQASALP